MHLSKNKTTHNSDIMWLESKDLQKWIELAMIWKAWYHSTYDEVSEKRRTTIQI